VNGDRLQLYTTVLAFIAIVAVFVLLVAYMTKAI
jgi:hypothetical protein